MRINTVPIPCSKTLITRKHQHINSVSTVKCLIIFQKIKSRYFGWFPNVFNFYGDSFNMFFYQLLVFHKIFIFFNFFRQLLSFVNIANKGSPERPCTERKNLRSTKSPVKGSSKSYPGNTVTGKNYDAKKNLTSFEFGRLTFPACLHINLWKQTV